MRKDVKIVCAWCNGYVGREQGWGVQRISYSVCPDCLAAWHKLRSRGKGDQIKHVLEKKRAGVAI
jgi:hypothetical protein